MELKHTIMAGLFLEFTKALIIIITSLCMPMFPGLIIVTKRLTSRQYFNYKFYENCKMTCFDEMFHVVKKVEGYITRMNKLQYNNISQQYE